MRVPGEFPISHRWTSIGVSSRGDRNRKKRIPGLTNRIQIPEQPDSGRNTDQQGRDHFIYVFHHAYLRGLIIFLWFSNCGRLSNWRIFFILKHVSSYILT